MSESQPAVGAFLETSDQHPGTAVERESQVDSPEFDYGELSQHPAAVKQLDPTNADVRRVEALKQRMDASLGDWKDEESDLRRAIRKQGMKVKTSKHFILLHDTSDTPAPNHKKPRADERLELLEQVYESFLLVFFSQGIELEIPAEYLKVVLIHDERDYLDYVSQLSPRLTSTAGFWDPQTNIAFFYDQGTGEEFKAIKVLSDALNEQRAESLKNKTAATKDIVRRANAISMLLEIEQENSDIEVVTHECTHQMAGNTGLFPRHVRVPTWAHEGLATFFEAPNQATWSGIGAVNEQRLSWYRALANRDDVSNVRFIVGDEIFSLARTHGAKIHAYGQSWALSHFLMERHFPTLINYYRRLGEMPPDIISARKC